MKRRTIRAHNLFLRCRGYLWYAGTMLLALLVGLGLNSGTIPESPGRWQPDAVQAVRLEGDWVTNYLTVRPQVGDHISSNLYVALAEGEYVWAAMYLDRERAALTHAIERSAPGVPGVSGKVQGELQMLNSYEHALNAKPMPLPAPR